MDLATNDIPRPARKEFGPLVVIGLPCALQLGFMYLLLSFDAVGPRVEMPVTVGGVAVLIGMALALTTAVMYVIYEVAEYNRRRRAMDDSARPWPF